MERSRHSIDRLLLRLHISSTGPAPPLDLGAGAAATSRAPTAALVPLLAREVLLLLVDLLVVEAVGLTYWRREGSPRGWLVAAALLPDHLPELPAFVEACKEDPTLLIVVGQLISTTAASQRSSSSSQGSRSSVWWHGQLR